MISFNVFLSVLEILEILFFPFYTVIKPMVWCRSFFLSVEIMGMNGILNGMDFGVLGSLTLSSMCKYQYFGSSVLKYPLEERRCLSG